MNWVEVNEHGLILKWHTAIFFKWLRKITRNHFKFTKHSSKISNPAVLEYHYPRPIDERQNEENEEVSNHSADGLHPSPAFARTRPNTPEQNILCGAKNTVVLGAKYLVQLRDIDWRTNTFSFTKNKAFCILLFNFFIVIIEYEGYQDSFGNIRNIFQVSRNTLRRVSSIQSTAL